jgi:hypothetical protein
VRAAPSLVGVKKYKTWCVLYGFRDSQRLLFLRARNGLLEAARVPFGVNVASAIPDGRWCVAE